MPKVSVIDLGSVCREQRLVFKVLNAVTKNFSHLLTYRFFNIIIGHSSEAVIRIITIYKFINYKFKPKVHAFSFKNINI